MSFFKIHSSNENVNVTDMFTLGVSTSRGTEKIGQFGSGCLMAALTWLRLFGESPVFFVNGEKITFSFQPVPKADGEVFNQVYIHSGTKKGIPISVSLEYGEKDWNTAGMALREWISNVLDQGEDIREADIVGPAKSIRNSKTGVTVFVRMNGEVMKYWSQIGENFLHYSNRQDIKLLPKAQPSKMKVYRRGVLIRSFDDHSLFDYNLDFDVSENRNGSSDSMLSKIRNTIAYNFESAMDDVIRRKILKAVVGSVTCFEADWESYIYIGYSWDNTLEKIGGTYVPNNILPGVGKEGSYIVSPKWYDMIVARNEDLDGMKEISLAEQKGFTTIPATNQVMDNFNRCWEFLDMIGMIGDTVKPTVECFKTSGATPGVLGMYTPATRTISIWNDQRASMQTMLEEICHHVSGASDCTRDFQEFLFRSLTETIENF